MGVAVLLLLVSGVILVACLQNAKAQGLTAPGRGTLFPKPRPRPLPPTPPDDQAPPNLSPLIPTQRAIADEYERGIRDLTLFLARPGE